MRFIRRIPVALLALACGLSLVGCVNQRQVAGNDTDSWPLLAPATLGVAITSNQVLRVAFGERDATLNCVVAVTPEKITIIGMTALGLRAFTVKYDGKQVSAEAQAAVPQAIPPNRLVNDLQFVYWPLATLQQAFANSEWQVTEPAPNTRRLRRGERLVAEVHYAQTKVANEQGANRFVDQWNGRAWLVNFEHGYSLNIESQRLEVGP
jgi:Protein of unknown function (DUF3261)